MRYSIIVFSVLFGLATSAAAQFSISIGLPGVSIGINVPVYPELVRVPGYPVYYAPRLQSNFFFYDGMYWVYEGDNWYASSWYNGPWGLVAPEAVPLFILRIPVRYYRSPPSYFRAWQADAPPRWGEHWGNAWQQQRSGWDRWNRRSAPAPAPLPTYQRQYSAARYPQQVEQQQVLRSRNYRYQPREAIVRQEFQQPAPPQAPQQHAPQQPPQQRAPRQAPTPPQREQQRAAPAQHPNPVPPVGRADHAPAPTPTAPAPRAPAVQEQHRQPAPAVAPREQRPPESARTAPAPRAPAVQEQPKQQARPAPAPHAQQPAAAKPKEGPQGRGQPQEKPDEKGKKDEKDEKDKKEPDHDRGRGG